MFRVLIAEGDTQLQNRLRGALAGAGFQTVTAADGAQALAAAEESAADILVLDAGRAFIVNVPQSKVITAISQDEMRDNVFTNIDGAVLLR